MSAAGGWGQRWALRLCLLAGRQAQALSICDRRLASAPSDTHARAARLHLLAQAGRADAALADSSLLVAAPGAAASDWFNHGFLLEARGAWPQALHAFEQALRLQPGLDRAWYGMGLVLLQLGRHDDALAAFRRNTELQPMSPHAWYQMATLHAQRQQAQAAIGIIRHLRGFEPKVARQLMLETGLSP